MASVISPFAITILSGDGIAVARAASNGDNSIKNRFKKQSAGIETMNSTAARTTRAARQPEPTWEIAHLFPTQGDWSEDEYLALDTNRIVEFSNGRLEVLPMPTTSHQMMAAYLFTLLQAFAQTHDLGTALMAALPIRLWRGKFREPDVVFMLKEHAGRIGEQFWKGADLVMEVVSGDSKGRRRDLVEKRRDYAKGRIPEYWIVDPREERITILRLAGDRYVVHGEYRRDSIASSKVIAGFSVPVVDVLAHQLPQRGRKRKVRKTKGLSQ